MSSKEVALKLDVSEATVVRFAQHLGFEGYPQFRQCLQNQLLNTIRSSERVASLLHDVESNSGPLQQMVSDTVQQLNFLVQNISDDEFSQVTRTVNEGRVIHIFGEGAPAAPTVQLGFWLNRLGFDVRVINQTGRRFFEHVFRVDPDDVGLVFAFRRVTPEAAALVEHFHDQGAKTVLFTDIANSAIHSLAANVLRVYRGPMGTFRPLGAVTAVCDALILSIMREKGDDAVRELKKLDDLRQRFGFL